MGCNQGCSMFWCFLFMMSGLALLGTGIWMAVDNKVYDSKVMENPDLMNNKTPWNGSVGGTIVVGIYTFLVGILGMAGTGCDLDKKIHNSLIAFTVFASIGVAAVIVCASISAWGYSQTDQEETKNQTLQDLTDLYTNESTDFSTGWDNYQLEYTCCGVEGYKDYSGSKYEQDTYNPVPWSCCLIKDGVDPADAGPGDVADYNGCKSEATSHNPGTNLHDEGCYIYFWDNYHMYQVIFLSLSWTAVFVQIVALFVAGCLRSSTD